MAFQKERRVLQVNSSFLLYLEVAQSRKVYPSGLLPEPAQLLAGGFFFGAMGPSSND